MKKGIDITDGNWHGTTLGQFIAWLVDSGADTAVAFRVIKDWPEDADGQFVRSLAVTLWPDNQVGKGVLGCHSLHKTLKALLEAKVVT